MNAHFAVLWTGAKFSMSDVLISGNVATLNLTNVGFDDSAAFVATTRLGTFTRVQITDNSCVWLDGKAKPSRGVVTFGNLTDFTLARNTFNGSRYAVSLITANPADRVELNRIAILDNLFVECGDGDIAMVLDLGPRDSVIDGLVVQGNKFFNAKPQARPVYSAAATQRNFRFGRNEAVNFVPTTRLVSFGGSPPTNFTNEIARAVSADRGDASVTLAVGVDAEVQRFASTLTANRTVSLSRTSAANGSTFRVIRTGSGAFTLDVGGLKTIGGASAAWAEVTFDGTAWRLTGAGTL